MDKIIIIPNGDWHIGTKPISEKKVRKLNKIRIKQLSKIAFKKWSGDIYEIEAAGCDFCKDARKRTALLHDKCEICYAPKYLCDENMVKYSLYNVFELLISDDYDDSARKAVNLMRIALFSMKIFGRVLKPIEWYIKWYLKRFETIHGDKDD